MNPNPDATQPAASDPLERFNPECLSVQQWALAKHIVLAAVRSVPDLPVKQRKPYASRLCRFLSMSAWDRTTTPDLAALLTDAAIGQLISEARMPELSATSRGSYRRVLRTIGRHLGSIPTSPALPPVSAGTPTRSFWLSARWAPVPFPVVAGAFAQTGHTCHPGIFTGFAQQLRDGGELTVDMFADLDSGACAVEGVGGTIRGVRQAVRDLRSADNIDLRVVSPMASSPSAPAPTHRAKAPSKPTSPTARARHARALLKAAKAAADAPTAIAETELPAINADVDAAIADYRPQRQDAATWAAIGGLVAHALRAFNPPSVRWVHDQAGHVTSFIVWAARTQRAVDADADLTADALLAPGLVDRYLTEELADRPDSSRATVRSILRRVVRNLSSSNPERLAYAPIQAPYTPAECASFVRLARNQPTADLRRGLSTVVALGLGAGLDGGDQREVTPADITEVDLGDGVTALLVAVRGQRPRTVVMRAAYEPLLREAIALHKIAKRGQHQPLYGDSVARRNVTSRVTSKAMTATGAGVDINAARLRATWLLACMNAPVPLAVLLHAAGLKTARTLTDLLAHCPPADESEVAAVLRAVEAPTVAGESR